uniref:Uncharacterized protein n=1 Tax=Setaria italica TaxID=4555 RepID=K4A0I5_SETIT
MFNSCYYDFTGHEYIVKWCEEDMHAVKGGFQMRFNPEGLIKLSRELSQRAITVIKQLGFGPCLSISLTSLCYKSLVVWIASHCRVAKYNNEDVIVLVFDPNSPRVITAEVLKIIHGIPWGTAKVPDDILHGQNATVKDLNGKVKDYNGDHVLKACSTARKNNDAMLEVRLFIAELFSF